MALNANAKEALAGVINASLDRIPGFLRGAVNKTAIAGFLKSIPADFRGYTLQELMDAIDDLNRENRIK